MDLIEIKKGAMTLITAHLFFNLIQYPKPNLNYGPILGGQVIPIPGTLTNSVENLEKKKIIEALKKCGSVKSRSAKLLGITARQFDYRINKYEIKIEKF